jgi:hypothetical protein
MVVGLFLGSQYKGLPSCAVTMFGDEAANQGQIYEQSMEAPSDFRLRKLPLRHGQFSETRVLY